MYQQAIADAKALRASAMANAKIALQEAFEPKITEMVRLKLSEELEEDQLEEIDEVEEGEGYEMEEGHDGIEETLDESGLDEILAELEELANEGSKDESYELEEAEENEDDDDETDDEEEAMDDEESEVEDTEEEIVDDETKVIDITLGDLKKVFQQLQSQEEVPAMDDIDLDGEEEEEAADEETFSLDEILAELENEGKEELEEKKMKKVVAKSEEEKELEEAKKTINQLQESFNEINLLNAKLLYMNKIFKAKSLSESEKIKVVKAFDKASSVKEVKNTFEILKESIATKRKSQIQESFGYASKPAGMSPSNNVIESDPFVSRWQKIAGL